MYMDYRDRGRPFLKGQNRYRTSAKLYTLVIGEKLYTDTVSAHKDLKEDNTIIYIRGK